MTTSSVSIAALRFDFTHPSPARSRISSRLLVGLRILALALFLFSLLLLKTPSADAAIATTDSQRFGLGIELGGPSGLSGNFWLDNRASVQGLLAFDFNDYFLYSMDYIYHYPALFRTRDAFTSKLAPYFGVGGVLVIVNGSRDHEDRYFGRHAGDFGLGVRVPIGIEWKPGQPSLGIFLEIAPGLAVAPETAGFVQGGIGIRYYF